jgi:Flp pilus assembly protein TadG
MRRPLRMKCRDERGAILIQVTVAMLGLLAFLTLVVDYGVMWMSRRQAQNSADAGALAGAIALAFDDPSDLSDTGQAKQAAHAAALANKVFGVAPDNNISTDITFFGPALGTQCPDGDVAATCVRVDVHRTAARGNPLPTFFAKLMSITSQDISATATAKVTSGTSVTCMRPFAIVDKWDEYNSGHAEHDYDNGVPDPDFDPFSSTFDKYPINGGGPPIPPEDDYYVNSANCAPGDNSCTPIAGTGYRPFADDGVTPVDYGRMVEIHTGAQDQTSAGFFQPVRLHPGDNGAADYCASIKTCDPTVSNSIGQVIETENGGMVGPTKQCLFTDDDSLKSLDPTAHWVDSYPGYPNGAVVSDDPAIAPNQSPRIVPLPVISPEEFYATDPNGHTTLVIHNILGFFVEDQTTGPGGLQVTRGRLITVPADDVGGSTTSTSSFLRKIILIR